MTTSTKFTLVWLLGFFLFSTGPTGSARGEGEIGLPGSRRSGPPATEIFQVNRVRKIISGNFISPRFTADGQQLILTGETHRGLWLAGLDGSKPVKIADDSMAGWRPVEARGREIIYRGAEIDERGEVRYRISVYDLKSGRGRLLYQGTKEDIYPPLLSEDGSQVLFVADRRLRSVALDPASRLSGGGEKMERTTKRVVFSDGGRIWAIEGGGEPKSISGERVTCGGEALSPDGLRVAYLHGDTNSIIVYEFATGQEVDLGGGSSLAWSPDSRLLFYNMTADDGHVVTASDLFAARPDGSGRQRLTAGGGVIWMNPAPSPDGRSIVCEDAATGDVYLLEISEKEAKERRI